MAIKYRIKVSLKKYKKNEITQDRCVNDILTDLSEIDDLRFYVFLLGFLMGVLFSLIITGLIN